MDRELPTLSLNKARSKSKFLKSYLPQVLCESSTEAEETDNMLFSGDLCSFLDNQHCKVAPVEKKKMGIIWDL